MLHGTKASWGGASSRASKSARPIFIVCGERHFDYLVKAYVERYHTERPHQGPENVPPSGVPPSRICEPPGAIVCSTRLGGLLMSFARLAA